MVWSTRWPRPLQFVPAPWQNGRLEILGNLFLAIFISLLVDDWLKHHEKQRISKLFLCVKKKFKKCVVCIDSDDGYLVCDF